MAAGCRAAALGADRQGGGVEQADAPRLDGDQPLVAEPAQELAHRLPVRPQALGQLLVAVAGDGAVGVGLPQQQGGEARGEAAEGERLQFLLPPPQAAANLRQEPQPDLRVAADQPLQVRPAQHADQALLVRLGVAAVHRLPEQPHLAEDRVGAEGGDHEFAPVGGQPIEVHPPPLQDEDDLPRLVRGVEDPAPLATDHRRALGQPLPLRPGEGSEDLRLEQVADLGRDVGRVLGAGCRLLGAPPPSSGVAGQVGQLALDRGRGRHQAAPPAVGAAPTSASSQAASGLPRLITRPSRR